MDSVVFPTPPLPPKRRTCRDARESNASANGERPMANGSLPVAGVDSDPLGVLALIAGDLFLPCANVAQRGEHLRLLLRVLRLGDIADLEHHLQLDETLLPELIVEQ